MFLETGPHYALTLRLAVLHHLLNKLSRAQARNFHHKKIQRCVKTTQICQNALLGQASGAAIYVLLGMPTSHIPSAWV